MITSVIARPKVRLAAALSMLIAMISPVRAHEVLPSIADMTASPGMLTFVVELNLEGFIAGIDLGATADTSAAPQAADYDALHALPPADLQSRFVAIWPAMAAQIVLKTDAGDLAPDLVGIDIPPSDNPDIPRISTLTFTAALPGQATTIRVGWPARFGALVLRQIGVDKPYDGYLEQGALSDPIRLAGGDQASGWQTFADYIPIGFGHILPKGLDHILFVLGLFLLSTRLHALLWQVSAFTAAHTLTLALGAAGYVAVPGALVEPLIAASIVFVAVENVLTSGLSRWRPFVVFGFGLLHGLGFASVLGEFGLPATAFLPALIGFNIGVELGQVTVIAAAFAAVGYWFGRKPWYRARISIPASLVIAAIGAWWMVERTLL